jgi:hypothetical protein
MQLEDLARERQERMAAQKRVKQLTREHPHRELERELQRLTEDLRLEREGRTHNHRERQRLNEDLQRERLARSEDQRSTRRPERELQGLQARWGSGPGIEEGLVVKPLEKQRSLAPQHGCSDSSNTFWGALAYYTGQRTRATEGASIVVEDQEKRLQILTREWQPERAC